MTWLIEDVDDRLVRIHCPRCHGAATVEARQWLPTANNPFPMRTCTYCGFKNSVPENFLPKWPFKQKSLRLARR